MSVDVKTQKNMVDVPKNVLPDQEGTSNVKEDVKPPEETLEPNAELAEVEATIEEVDETLEVPAPKGSKTPETLLYAKLKEEREKRKELEQRIKDLENTSSPSEEEQFTDTEKDIKGVTERLLQLERKELMREILSQYPQLVDKRDEFDEFLEDEENAKISLQKAARLFLLDKGLLETQKPIRKGLETPTGGSKVPQATGFAEADVKRLRENQPKKYLKMIREGKIKPEEIK